VRVPVRYADPAMRAGVARLGQRGLTYDTWHYHHQNDEFTALAQAVPDTLMVLDHFGTPLGVGSALRRPRRPALRLAARQ